MVKFQHEYRRDLTLILTVYSSVSDPDSLIPDSHPAFEAEYQSESRVLMTKKIKKIKTEKKLAIYRYLPLSLRKERPSYRRSLQPSKRGHPALPNIKFLNFFLILWAFLPFWIRIRIH
jgi:hypothetical protein